MTVEETVRAFIDASASFFGVTSGEIDVPRVEKSATPGSWLLAFRQIVRGVPIRGANVRVVIDPDTS